jgi:hypothetical protein
VRIDGAKLPIWCNNAGVTITLNSFYISTRDGISLRMLQWSSVDESPGIPILLIHGLASNARLWDGPARRLVELGHAVTAIDLRGHGLSDKPDTGYDMANIADDVLDVVNALGARQRNWVRPLVLGQSWGGNIVVEYAHRYGDTIRGIVAVDGGTIELSEAFPEWELCKTTMRLQQLPVCNTTNFVHTFALLILIGAKKLLMAKCTTWSACQTTQFAHTSPLIGTLMYCTGYGCTSLQHCGLTSRFRSCLRLHLAPTTTTPNRNVRKFRIALDNLAHGRVEWFTPADHDLHAQFPLQFAGVVDDAITSGFFS